MPNLGEPPDNRTYCRTQITQAVADTGAQTCSSGPEILEVLGCSSNILIPTSNRMHGITYDQLHIKGIVFMHIKVGLKETRQVVYVLENTSGFYVSESALKDLGLIPHSFPSQTSKADMVTMNNGKAQCGCP